MARSSLKNDARKLKGENKNTEKKVEAIICFK